MPKTTTIRETKTRIEEKANLLFFKSTHINNKRPPSVTLHEAWPYGVFEARFPPNISKSDWCLELPLPHVAPSVQIKLQQETGLYADGYLPQMLKTFGLQNHLACIHREDRDIERFSLVMTAPTTDGLIAKLDSFTTQEPRIGQPTLIEQAHRFFISWFNRDSLLQFSGYSILHPDIVQQLDAFEKSYEKCHPGTTTRQNPGYCLFSQAYNDLFSQLNQTPEAVAWKTVCKTVRDLPFREGAAYLNAATGKEARTAELIKDRVAHNMPLMKPLLMMRQVSLNA
ncbi:MAG: hypothetical protein AB7E52_00400 [Bdellovibrionales bacterium]